VIKRSLSPIIIALGLLVTPSAWGDTAHFGDGALIVPLGNKPTLALVKADVSVVPTGGASVGPEKMVGAYLPTDFKVDATFVVKNPTGTLVREEFAIPVWSEFLEADAPVGMKNLQVTVGKRATKAAVRNLSAKAPWAASIETEQAYVFGLSLAAKKSVTIRLRYSLPALNSMGGAEVCMQGPKAIRTMPWWLEVGDSPSGWKFKESYCRSFSFWLFGLDRWPKVGSVAVSIRGRLNRPFAHLNAPVPAPKLATSKHVRWSFSGMTAPPLVSMVWLSLIFQDDAFRKHLPLFDSLAQAQSWVAHAKKSSQSAAMVGDVLALYALRRGQRVSAATRKLWKWRPVDGKPGSTPAGAQDDVIEKFLRKELRKWPKR
jgi:hypothetical protein